MEGLYNEWQKVTTLCEKLLFKECGVNLVIIDYLLQMIIDQKFNEIVSRDGEIIFFRK